MTSSELDNQGAFIDSPDFVVSPSHRLFSVFDTADGAKHAIAMVRGEGLIDDEKPWLFCGEDGIRQLDVHGAVHGLHGRVARAIQLAMSNDVAYLTLLVRELRAGHAVIAVLIADVESADQAAHRLRELSGHTMAIGAHFDFIPVSGGYTW